MNKKIKALIKKLSSIGCEKEALHIKVMMKKLSRDYSSDYEDIDLDSILNLENETEEVEEPEEFVSASIQVISNMKEYLKDDDYRLGIFFKNNIPKSKFLMAIQEMYDAAIRIKAPKFERYQQERGGLIVDTKLDENYHVFGGELDGGFGRVLKTDDYLSIQGNNYSFSISYKEVAYGYENSQGLLADSIKYIREELIKLDSPSDDFKIEDLKEAIDILSVSENNII